MIFLFGDSPMTGTKSAYLAVLAVLLLPMAANAGLIVNTGPGAGGNVGGPSLNSNQHLAGEFTTTQDWLINSIEGWISLATLGETGTVAIYSDGGAAPGVELFSAAFGALANSDAEWEGAFGLGWLLGTGTYWATFEVRAGQTFAGAMPTGAPNPLFTTFDPGGDGSWAAGGGFPGSIGIRIDASEPTTVPEPGTLALLGIGLFGMGLARRRKKV